MQKHLEELPDEVLIAFGFTREYNKDETDYCWALHYRNTYKRCSGSLTANVVADLFYKIGFLVAQDQLVDIVEKITLNPDL